MPLRNLSLNTFLKILAAAISYGILLGQVMQIDQRLARVENYIITRAEVRQTPDPFSKPPAYAGDKEK
jgi:hypothetical protein